MKTDNRKILKLSEIILICVVWIVLILAPMIYSSDRSDWRSMMRPLNTLVPLFIIFLLNRFVLVPRLLFRNKLQTYIVTVVAIIFIFTLASYIFQGKGSKEFVPGTANPPVAPLRDPVRGPGGEGRPLYPLRPDQPGPVPPFANLLILSILLVGFDTGLKSTFRWAGAEQDKARLEKENVSNQLDFLKNQVSPHFFMNTLNNIHTLIDISPEKGKDAIVKLSKMMRYLLYDTEHGSTTLKKEIEFIMSYVDLMKLRVSEKVEISTDFPQEVPEISIPPLIFTSFIENAFKHGISYQKESFIRMKMILDEKQLMFNIENSKSSKDDKADDPGIGIENARKRLNLLYADNYHLDIIDNDDNFTVNLLIPL